MIIFKENIFFAKPREFTQRNIEFDIYNCKGNYIGSNFSGIFKELNLTKEDKFKLEELIEDYTYELEIKMKFLKEYKAKIDAWTGLDFSKNEILQTMDSKWNIPNMVMDKVLEFYSSKKETLVS